MSWVGCYSFCLTAVHVMGDNIDIQAIPDRTIRPQRLVTNVEKPEQVVVRDLLVAGQSQLAGPLDMFMFSLDYCREVREDFLKECGLAGATDEQIDDYLDASV